MLICGDQNPNPDIDACKKFEQQLLEIVTQMNSIKNDIVLLLKTDGGESFLTFRNVYIRSDKTSMPIRYEFCALLPKLYAKSDAYCRLFQEKPSL